jgi:hypothetical protein
VCGFLRGFRKIWALNVVFLWTGCGELSGKDGLLADGFWGLWILQFFGIYFLGARVASLPSEMRGFFAALRMTGNYKRKTTTATTKTNTWILRFAQNDDIKRLQ